MNAVSRGSHEYYASPRKGDAGYARTRHNTPNGMKRVGSVHTALAVAFAAVLLASSFDTAWTARTPVHLTHVDPSLSAGEVALVHTTVGHAGALSFKLAELGAVEIETADAADTVIARLSNQALAALRSDPTVTVATRNTTIVATGGGRDRDLDSDGDPSPEPSAGAAAINAPLAWHTATGAGVTVAVMDSGIAEHPDLAPGKVAARVNFVYSGSRDSLDPAGHGTHIAGIIAANGSEFRGVAPDARLVSLRVLDANGYGYLRDVVRAFDWVLRYHVQQNIKVLNLSWGAPHATSYHSDLVSALAESAWFAGVTVVAAAGNAGASRGSVTTPGGDPFVITVGSLDDQGTVPASDDRESSFSSRGLTMDGFAKPDVLAPGRHVVSLRAVSSKLASVKPENVVSSKHADKDKDKKADRVDVSGLYVTMSGTSASAGFVSGVAALVASAHPSYGPTKIKGAIVASGRAVTDSATPAVDANRALTAMTSANAGLVPSKLLVAFLRYTGMLLGSGITWEGVTWESVTWEAVTWEKVSWQSVSWERTVSWEGVVWETVGAQ